LTSENTKRNKGFKETEKGLQDSNSTAVTDPGDTSRDITDTADASRAVLLKAEES
jgi:hypothetical protein